MYPVYNTETLKCDVNNFFSYNKKQNEERSESHKQPRQYVQHHVQIQCSGSPRSDMVADDTSRMYMYVDDGVFSVDGLNLQHF